MDKTKTAPKMEPTQALNEDQLFFFEHAGYSWNAKAGETPEQGRTRGAIALEVAERAVRNLRHAEAIQFVWEHDDQTNESFEDTDEPYALWQCCLMVGDTPASSVGGVDFGRDGSPVGDAYARVIEAELAAEWLPEYTKAQLDAFRN
jgi:hypothetical protein